MNYIAPKIALSKRELEPMFQRKLTLMISNVLAQRYMEAVDNAC